MANASCGRYFTKPKILNTNYKNTNLIKLLRKRSRSHQCTRWHSFINIIILLKITWGRPDFFVSCCITMALHNHKLIKSTFQTNKQKCETMPPSCVYIITSRSLPCTHADWWWEYVNKHVAVLRSANVNRACTDISSLVWCWTTRLTNELCLILLFSNEVLMTFTAYIH